jgi:hypothetical protein
MNTQQLNLSKERDTEINENLKNRFRVNSGVPFLRAGKYE